MGLCKMSRYGVVLIKFSDGIFMLRKTVLKASFGTPYVKNIITRASQLVHNKSGIAINKICVCACFLGFKISKNCGLQHVVTVVTIHAFLCASWFLEPSLFFLHREVTMDLLSLSLNVGARLKETNGGSGKTLRSIESLSMMD